jgi:hypothetical protein
MSNSLAIATVTATLRAILDDVASHTVNGAVATFLRPDSTNLPALGVNIFLYQVAPNPAFRNSDLPTRKADGTLLQRPQAALDLHYLLTFHGDDADLVPQLLLGAVALKLHAEPILTRAQIAQAAAQETGSGAFGHFLVNSDLADQSELVRITPADLSLEDMNKLWMTFPQVDYVLSAVYVASVVLIETTDVLPGPALRVKQPIVHAVPSAPPYIASVAPPDITFASPLNLILLGRNFNPASDQVTFAGVGAGTVTAGSTDQALNVTAPAGLLAGFNSVQVIRSAPLSPPDVSDVSNLASFLLRPSYQGAVVGPGRLVTVTVAPAVAANQVATLILNPVGGGAAPPPPVAADAIPPNTTSPTLVFHADALPAGTYLARVSIDGAESLLTGGGPGVPFSGPLVVLT